MSGAINGYGLMAALSQDSAAIQSQLSVATQQAATGKVSDSYAGLGAAARVSLDLRPQIAHQTAWSANIDAVSARLAVAQSALTAINQVASTFYAKMSGLNGLTPGAGAAVAAQARTALEQVAGLLNSKVGDTYVFSGQDTANPPVTNPSAAALIPALLTGTPPAPFSATIGTAVPTVEVGEGQQVQVGVLANANTLSVSAAPTSGSYMRDIMTALATLATTTDGPGLPAVAATVRSQLDSAITASAAEAGALGNNQAGLATRKSQLAETQAALTAQVSGAEDVDLAATVTRVTALQAQLQASYHLLAAQKGMSLAQYL
ncbi:MAG TPA: flagellin [Acetobacteraceae bacterium]